MFFFFNVTATTEIYTYCHTLSLHDALPISAIIHYEEERATAYRHRWATFVQVYDPDRIDTPAEQVGNPNVREGQIFDKWNRRVGPFVRKAHPSDYPAGLADMAFERVPRENKAIGSASGREREYQYGENP